MKKPEAVGTELSKLIPAWAVSMKDGCGCRDMAKKMDRWGVDGCERRRARIVSHLTQQTDKLIPAFRAASGLLPASIKMKVASILLDKAIKNAKNEEGQ